MKLAYCHCLTNVRANKQHWKQLIGIHRPFSPAMSLCPTRRNALHLIHRQLNTSHCNLQANMACSLLCLFLPIYSLPTSQAPSLLVVPRETTRDTSGYFNSLKQLMIKGKHKGQELEITKGPSCLKKSHVNRCKPTCIRRLLISMCDQHAEGMLTQKKQGRNH